MSCSACALIALLLVAPTAGAGEVLLGTWSGLAIEDGFGRTVATVGDVNNDGKDDLIVGLPYDDTVDTDAGKALLIDAATGAVIHTFLGDAAGDCFGWSVAGIGDLDGDSKGDIAVGAPLRDLHGVDAGTAHAYSSNTGIELFMVNALDGSQQHFGKHVAAAGDVDGDGTPDLLVGAPFSDVANFVRSGRVRVYSGVTGLEVLLFEGVRAFDFLGHDAVGLGDLNGDGKSEILIGAYGVDNGQATNAGRIYLVDGATGAQLYATSGKAAGDEFGRSVDVIADLDADGRNDYIVGAWGRDGNGLEAGSYDLFSGLTGASISSDVDGLQRAELSGFSVAGLGDMNGDTIPDIAVGAWAHDDAGNISAGVLRVHSGFDNSVLFEIPGSAANQRMGWAVANGGDIDGDGNPDVLVGAPYRHFSAGAVGTVRAYGWQ